MVRSHAAVLSVVLAFMMPLNGRADDDFDALRLQAGRMAWAAGENARAAEEFRIAAFGLNDRPALLAEALARLAVAEQAIGREEAARDAVRRFAALAVREPDAAQLVIEAPVRSAFEKMLATHNGASGASSDADARGARALMDGGHHDQAVALLERAVADGAASRELRLLLLEAATRSNDFSLALTQLKGLSPLVAGEETAMFWGAVALHGSGRVEDARALLQRAMEKVTPTEEMRRHIARMRSDRR